MSVTRHQAFRCDVCGRFVALQALTDGKATHKEINPDNHFSGENFETLCENCAKPGLPPATKETEP